ncbi:MAG: hypothetical protein GY838_13160 [bacterium]|nr:hypothetical protein [bacterium]
MSQREFIVNGQIKLVENAGEHGTWMVTDIESGRRLATAVRLVSEIGDVLAWLEKEAGRESEAE